MWAIHWESGDDLYQKKAQLPNVLLLVVDNRRASVSLISKHFDNLGRLLLNLFEIYFLAFLEALELHVRYGLIRLIKAYLNIIERQVAMIEPLLVKLE